MSHRGDLRSHSENTLPAFEAALAAGVRHVELDLQINASGTPVVLHDPGLRRTHGSEGSVFDQTDGGPLVLPTLAEVLDLGDRYPGTVFALEVKHDSLQRWGEQFVLDRLLPWAERIKGHVVFSTSVSFLALVRTAGLPHIGVILREWSPAKRAEMVGLSPDLLVINQNRVPVNESLWPGAWRWAVYEIGDFPTALHWGDRGADFALSFYAVELEQQRRAMIGG